MYTAVLRSVCSYKFLEISLFRKKSSIGIFLKRWRRPRQPAVPGPAMLFRHNSSNVQRLPEKTIFNDGEKNDGGKDPSNFP
ncbi:MAG: hypothetical protein LBJ16_02430 [Holosporaceae bacterium]|nr:hypothetical protein [Holosporaceae bacterium]